MSSDEPDDLSSTVEEADRRATVLESALVTFAHYGYRKTSMEDVARAAHISRPGLYFLFTSKEALFRAAVTRALQQDIDEIERVLANSERPLDQRLLEAFDRWAGRYIGPLSRGISAVIEGNPGLLGAIVEITPRRFEELVTDALTAKFGAETAARVVKTLISTSIGIKHQVATRDAYLEGLEVAIGLIAR